jgi:hypothetical protein
MAVSDDSSSKVNAIAMQPVEDVWVEINVKGTVLWYNKATKECKPKKPESIEVAPYALSPEKVSRDDSPERKNTSKDYYDELNYDDMEQEQEPEQEPVQKSDWVVCFDHNEQAHYFYHSKYRLTTWSLPKEIKDLFYDYSNNYSKSLWHLTSPSPPWPWDVFLTESGDIYYFNSTSEESQWAPPME